uniref:conserved oligomeric Golgi complex subunit 2 n=1 Tax=Panthera onca TaxID=9690 RepID=UPI002954339D|nr:conserved oligomeric Golgi complex subunit 2 [Panthera onca]
MEKSRMNLPKGPDTLCFDKDEFMKEDFDVDHFVSDCRKRVQLEELRGDLELYYRLLKTAMVELINKDYADFVNLSTNLVGMDKALNQLSVPLGQLREEVLVSPYIVVKACSSSINPILCSCFSLRFREIAGSLEAALTAGLEDAPAGSSFCLLASHRTWSSLQRCWSDEMFLPVLAHRLWRLTLQILARYSVFVSELLLRPISNESAKDIKKPLVTGGKEPSVTQGNSEDQASGPAETRPVASISSTQLIYVVADLDKLQEQLPELLETIKPKLEMIGFKNFSSISAALEDSQTSLSACAPALSDRIIQDLSESCFGYLKSALEVPRLYRRTNKEVPTTASSYVDSALKPFRQLQSGHKDKLRQAVIRQWLEGALSESTHKYYETVSDVLNSVKKMEESLKRLKQARKTTPANPIGPGGGMSDDDKIRLQLALDVEYLGEQIQKMGLATKDIKSFPALAELVAATKDQATAEQP